MPDVKIVRGHEVRQAVDYPIDCRNGVALILASGNTVVLDDHALRLAQDAQARRTATDARIVR